MHQAGSIRCGEAVPDGRFYDAAVTEVADVTEVAEADRVHIPAEGEDGLFRQSWYPICLSSEVAEGEVIGRGFLDGRVIVFRTDDGVARVMSAFCPHLGADLAVGEVVDQHVQCAFHHWHYDTDGVCVSTGIGDRPPPSARLFRFPSVERWGIVWVFNGEEPLFDLPLLTDDEHRLAIGTYKHPDEFTCDPWVFAANTPDLQHIQVVHKLRFTEDPYRTVEWTPWGLTIAIKGLHQGDVEIDWRIGLCGTGFFWRTGTTGGHWSGAITGFGLHEPGRQLVYGAYFVREGPESSVQLEAMRALTERTIGEDRELLSTIRYRQGQLTRADRLLARYLDLVRDYPRAHPSAPFIK